jgi:hypothetical protein
MDAQRFVKRPRGMTNRRSSALVAILIVAITVVASTPAAAGTNSTHCGVERWGVKTLTDGSHFALTPHPSTIAKLVALPVPPGFGRDAGRLPGEDRVYRLRGAMLVEAKLEADSDYHLVLRSATGQTMIAEIPSPSCIAGSTALEQITAARAAFDSTFGAGTTSWHLINQLVTITGVAFFDVKHHQSGVADNGIELHPVLSVTLR